MPDLPLAARLTAMYDHRGDGIPTQPVNPDGEEAVELLRECRSALFRLLVIEHRLDHEKSATLTRLDAALAPL